MDEYKARTLSTVEEDYLNSIKNRESIIGISVLVFPVYYEGFWWQDGVDGVDYMDKSTFNWISVIRHPIKKA